MGSPECIALVQEATRRLGLRQFHDAIELATRAIRLDPRHAPAYLVRAMALRKLNQADRSLVDLTLAVRLEPDRPTPYVIRAEILARRCQFDQAVADATQALFLDPGNAAAYSVRAQCRHALGDREGAAEDVQQMLLIDPTRPVPDLGSRSVSDPSSATAADDERFWKRAAGREDERALFADGKPVDRTYRSRQVVGDEEAPEALGVASGYKPEVIARPIPRMRGRAKKSLGHGGGGAILMLGVVMVAGFSLWLVFRGAPGPEPGTISEATQGPKVARSTDPPQPASTTTRAVDPLPDDRRRRPPAAVARADTDPPMSEISAPADAVRFEGHAYKFFPEVLSWHRAKARCEEMGGHLATIGSREENDFVRSLALRGIARPGPLDGAWLGATDEHKEGAWEWVDGSRLSFTQWGPDQPNNKQNREHYLLLFLPRNEWSDQPNESTQHVAYFVCEWDRQPRSTPSGSATADMGEIQGELRATGLDPIGSWVEFRPGTMAGRRMRTFTPDGHLIFQLPDRNNTVKGTWRKGQGRVYFSHPSTDGREPPTVDKWFVIKERSRESMTILMMGQREYVWYPASPIADTPLEGEWAMVSEETNGVTDTATQERRITITGDDFVMSRTRNGRPGAYTGKVTFDRAARTFDFVGQGPMGTHQEFKGIYEIDGDTLRLCYVYSAGNAARRPTQLRSYQVPGTTMISLVLKRRSGR